jgi:hypothetical protein
MIDVDLHGWFKGEELEPVLPVARKEPFVCRANGSPLSLTCAVSATEVPDAGTERSGD